MKPKTPVNKVKQQSMTDIHCLNSCILMSLDALWECADIMCVVMHED